MIWACDKYTANVSMYCTPIFYIEYGIADEDLYIFVLFAKSALHFQLQMFKLHKPQVLSINPALQESLHSFHWYLKNPEGVG